jgi:NAD(P)-dependent dehydrogenase (short-subunit alcohol dehydrogenase family)
VNCVAPTWREPTAEAKPSPAQKPAPATDAAQTVLFLASEESAGLTGQQLVVGQ